MKRKFPVKRLGNGRAMLNLGCGTTMDWRWTNLDFSTYARLARHKALARMLRRIGLLSEERYEALLTVDHDIVLWDLRKGIPFPDRSFDVVYHSHLLEHIERKLVPSFLKDCYRVLRRGGLIRVVVPDLQAIVNRYVLSVSRLKSGDESALSAHQEALYDLFDQMVRREPTGTKQQRPLVRLIERTVRGGIAKTGELHRWMYDKHSLRALLLSAGFKDVREEGPLTSRIQGWNSFNLDTNENGTVRKSKSLYMEGSK